MQRIATHFAEENHRMVVNGVCADVTGGFKITEKPCS
jgi:hypothetical protein